MGAALLLLLVAAAGLFSGGAMPVGAGVGGAVAQWFGLRAAFRVFTALTAPLIVPFLVIMRPGLVNAPSSGRAP